MRALFSIAALLIVVAIVALVARQQLASVKVPELAASSPGQTAAGPAGSPAARQNVQQQLDQLKKELDTAAQQSTRRLEEAER